METVEQVDLVEEQVENTAVVETDETVEVAVEVTVEPQEVADEPQENVVEESKETVPTFETLEDYNKLLQSTSSKAKNELLKEIGLGSVAEIKEAIKKGNGVESIVNELTSVKQELETLRAEKKAMEDIQLLNEVGIPADKGEMFLKLVDADTSDLSRQEKAIKIKNDLASMIGTPVTIGTGKTQERGEIEKLQDEFEKLRKL